MPSRDTIELDYASIIEESLNEIYIFNADSLQFILVNRGARNNIGYSMAELRELTPVDIKPNYDRSQFMDLINPLLEHKVDKIDFHTEHQRKNGSRYDVEVHLQRRQFHRQDVFVAIILDITSAVTTKRELAFSKSLLESAPDAMVVTNGQGRIVIANRQMEKLLGYSGDELLSMSVDDFVPLAKRAEHAQHREEFNRNPRWRGMGTGMNLEAVTKDGDLIPIEVSLSPIDDGGRRMVAAAIRDITQRKEFEIRLQESEEQQRLARREAERATTTKSRFLAAASHDLRQPLQALRLYISIMKSSSTESNLKELADKMHLSLNTMSELLETLLDISSLESGTVKVDIREVDLPELIERLAAANAPQINSKGLNFEQRVDKVTIKTDPVLLERILENFMSNAIRYTNSGDIKLLSKVDSNKVRISVTDSGVGISEKSLTSVFDEYYQIDNQARDHSKGLGLGLSIVKHIARILDHEIFVESELGSGSCFSVEVPLVRSKTHQSASQSLFSIQLLPTLLPHTVLVIDDDVTIVNAMASMLELHGINVAKATSGVDALKQVILGLQPTVIITDYRMPQLNGVETLQAIRNELGNDIPVIIMTGDTSAEPIKETAINNVDVITKPIDENIMNEIIALFQ